MREEAGTTPGSGSGSLNGVRKKSSMARTRARRVSSSISSAITFKTVEGSEKKLRWNNVVHQISEHEVVLHEVVSFPAPHRNREFIVKQLVLRMPDSSSHIILRFSMEKGTDYCSPSKKNILGEMDVGGFILRSTNSGQSTLISAYNEVNLKGAIPDMALKSIASLFAGDCIDECTRYFNKERLWPTSATPMSTEERVAILHQKSKIMFAKTEIAQQGLSLLQPTKGGSKNSNVYEWKCLKMNHGVR